MLSRYKSMKSRPIDLDIFFGCCYACIEIYSGVRHLEELTLPPRELLCRNFPHVIKQIQQHKQLSTSEATILRLTRYFGQTHCFFQRELRLLFCRSSEFRTCEIYRRLSARIASNGRQIVGRTERSVTKNLENQQ